MGRKWPLIAANTSLLNATKALKVLRAHDVKSRKSKALARLKPKYTADIERVDLLLETIVLARKILKGLPKAVQ